MPKTMPKTAPKTARGESCEAARAASREAVRAAFEESLSAGQTVYLRVGYEGHDGQGNPQWAKPRTEVKIESVTTHPATGRWFHCRLTVQRTAITDGWEKPVRAPVSFQAGKLCAKPKEAELV